MDSGKWRDDQLDILKQEYIKKTTAANISKMINRSVKSIRNKACKLGITDTSDNWTREQIEFLRAEYKSYNLQEISRKLNKHKTNVCRKAKELGIERTRKQKETTLQDLPKRTKQEQAELRSVIMKAWHTTHEHPRGMLGKSQTENCKLKCSHRLKTMWADPKSSMNSEEHRQNLSDRMMLMMIKNTHSYSRGKSGKRADLNDKYFRSSWEANYARYLNLLISKGNIFKWEYEPDVFFFEAIKRGTRSYTPDFKIWKTENSEPYYVEVKGWMDDKSRVKLKRMKKYYPEIKIELFQQAEYTELKNKLSRLIAHWE